MKELRRIKIIVGILKICFLISLTYEILIFIAFHLYYKRKMFRIGRAFSEAMKSIRKIDLIQSLAIKT